MLHILTWISGSCSDLCNSLFKLRYELYQLVEEGNRVLDNLRKEGREVALDQSRDKNCNSEKNQIRPCDLVWFPSVLAHVPEHAVLSMRHVCFFYETHQANKLR